MPELSRREFLRLTALGLGAVAAGGIVEACKSAGGGAALSSLAATATAGATGTKAATAAPATLAQLAPGGIPDLAVAKGGEPEALVRRAVAALGGMEKFVPKGSKVVVKPNICVSYRTYEYGATTNPWVVGTLVKMALEAGAASVKVMDNPFSGDAPGAYTTSGIEAQVKAAGGQMVVMNPRRYIATTIPDGVWLKAAEIYEDVLKADVIINAPLVKDHSLSRMTAAMKNLMGVVAAPADMHVNLGQAIADLHTRIRPKLTVVDAVRVLTRGGPEGGFLEDVKKLDTVVAGVDMVAADAYVAAFLDIKPGDLDFITAGEAMGLGKSDLSRLQIKTV